MLTLWETLLAITYFVLINSPLIWQPVFDWLAYHIRRWRQQLKYPRFYGTKPMPPRPGNANVLELFHGRADGIHNEQLIAYDSEWVYTVDKNASKNPDYCADIMTSDLLASLPEAGFDKILVNNCICCTADVAKFQGIDFIAALVRLLKPRGRLYIKHHDIYQTGLKPINPENLNKLGLRGYNGKTLNATMIGRGWLALIKEPSMPLLEEVKDYTTDCMITNGSHN